MLEYVRTSSSAMGMGVAPVKVLLSRWYISRLMVSERIDRQAHGILKVFSIIPSEKRGLLLGQDPCFICPVNDTTG